MPKVLVVDDSVSVRKVVERALAGRQVDVVSAASGGEALERIEAEAPDVIVCDVVMPDRDGYEICDFVKNHPRLAATPVILMSGIVNDEVRQRAEQARSEGVLSKPFAAEDLLKRLDSVIGPLPPRSAEPPAPTIATPTLMPVSPLTVEPVGAPEPSSRPDPAASITSMLESLIATDADRRAAATPAPVVDARLDPPRPPMRESLGADAGTSSVSPVREADAAPSAPADGASAVLSRFAAMDGVQWAVLADREGLVVEATQESGVAADIAAALSACLAESSSGVGRELGGGALQSLILEYESGMVVIYGVGTAGLLAVGLGESSVLGKVRYFAKKALPELARAL